MASLGAFAFVSCILSLCPGRAEMWGRTPSSGCSALQPGVGFGLLFMVRYCARKGRALAACAQLCKGCCCSSCCSYTWVLLCPLQCQPGARRAESCTEEQLMEEKWHPLGLGFIMGRRAGMSRTALWLKSYQNCWDQRPHLNFN